MKIKKTLVLITFMLAILPAAVYAQESLFTSISKLPSDARSIGIGYETFERFHNIAVRVERGFTDIVKGGTVTVVRFSEYNTSDFLLSQLFDLMYTDALGTTDLDYFIIGAVGGTYLYTTGVERRYVINDYSYPYSGSYKYVGTLKEGVHSLDVIGGGGLVAPLNQLKPFVSYAFRYRRTVHAGSENSHIFSGGIEVDISQKIRLIGRANWPVSSKGFRNPTLEIGINFY